MKLIVGLGNPGRKYDKTRHNIGFEVIEELSSRFGGGFPRSRFQGETIDAEIDGEKVLLLKPQTYMNRSGESVQQAKDFFKLNDSELLVVCDDINLPLGKLRVRCKGSSGGQKGLADIIQKLGGDTFPRLRIGIGAPPPEWDCADYVLGRFSSEERDVAQDAVQRAVDVVRTWMRSGIAETMNQFNAG